MQSYRSISGFTFEIARRRATAQNHGDGQQSVVGTFDDRALCAWLECDPEAEGKSTQPAAAGHPYVFGDGQDALPCGEQFLGYGVLLHINRSTGHVRIRTSLSGVPPVFVYQERERSVVASSIDRIAAIPGVQLAFDPQGLVELAMIGQPIKHRTLFRNVSVVSAGIGLAIDATQGVRQIANWQQPADPPFTDQQEYMAAQSDALAAAMSRIDVSRSFLSLTAGLDSRTILALLVRDGRTLPALTMSGTCTSLDARRAAELCRSYGMSHHVIRLNEEFIRHFPECALEASRRSGGLASFRQASEVFFYRRACSAYIARLSGNLGNQVGRSGPESANMRGVAPEVLAGDVRAVADRMHDRHWFAEIGSKGGGLGPLDLIQQESLFASMGNSCIGGSFATQQTPYGDRTVIVQKLREPVVRSEGASSILTMRLRDLKHRFLGDPIRASFQRQLVARVGGVVARSPVNWGWRPSGSVSFGGVALGTLALVDMAVNTQLARGGMAARLTARTGLDGFSGFQYIDLMRKRPVAEFVYDTLRAQRCAVLDPLVLRRALETGFDDRSSRAMLLFALDVVLAQQSFAVAS